MTFLQKLITILNSEDPTLYASKTESKSSANDFRIGNALGAYSGKPVVTNPGQGTHFDSDLYFTGCEGNEHQISTQTNTTKQVNVANANPAQDIPNNTAQPRNIMTNFRQGTEVGNCVGVVMLQSLIRDELGLEYLNSIVKRDENNNYVVTFPNKEPITINQSLINRYRAVDGNDYVEAITFALYKDAGKLDDNGNFLLKGKVADPSKTNLDTKEAFTCLTGVESTRSRGTLCELKEIEEELAAGKNLLILTSFKSDKFDKDTHGYVVDNHAYSLVGVDTQNKKVQLIDPHDYNYNNKQKIIELSIETFLELNTCLDISQIINDHGNISFTYPKVGQNSFDVEMTKSQPTDSYYDSYFSQSIYKNEDNIFTHEFLKEFDKKGYGCLHSEWDFKSNDALKKQNAPIYSLLKEAGYTPKSLVYEYCKTHTLPDFKAPELKQKSAYIRKWLDEQYTSILREFTEERLSNENKQIVARNKALLEAEEAIKEAEKLKAQKELETHNKDTVLQIQNETFNSILGSSNVGEFPVSLDEIKKIDSNAKVTIDKNNKSKTITYKSGDCSVKITTEKNEYGNYTKQEILDNNGNLLARNNYDHDKNISTQETFITDSNGKSLRKLMIEKSLSKSSERYSIVTTRREVNEYAFFDNGSVKARVEKSYENAPGRIIYEYNDNGKIKGYWNDYNEAIDAFCNYPNDPSIVEAFFNDKSIPEYDGTQKYYNW